MLFDPDGDDGFGERPVPGLCERCRLMRRIQNDRGSVFYLCKLAESDDRFPQYPRIPVVTCLGYEDQGSEEFRSHGKPGTATSS